MTIRLLLVDDQDIVRRGLKALLRQAEGVEVIGEAGDGQAALQAIARELPDVVLMDIRMPVMDGVAATKAITQQFPTVKVLVLTTFDDEEYVTRAIAHGASGYLLKDTPLEDLVQTIQAVQRGYLQLGPGLAQKLVMQPKATPMESPELLELTPREREILQQIAQGSSNREIAQALYISEKTVKNHVTNILSRLGLRDRTQAALFAKDHAV